MDVEFAITEANPEDAEVIRDLAVRIWNACYPGIISQGQIDYMLDWMYSPRQIRVEIEKEGIVYLRIEGPAGLLGFAAFGPGEGADEAVIHKIYIDARFQGCGIGSAAMREIEARVREQGCHRISLRVNRQNTQAIGAYKKAGFRRIDTVCSDIGGDYVMDDYLMAKSLH